MAALHVSDIAQMRDLLEQLFLKMGECTGRVSLAKIASAFRASRRGNIQYVYFYCFDELMSTSFVYL